MPAATVAILGTRYRDLAIEEEILGPLDVRFAVGAGGNAAEILEIAARAQVILAGAAPRFDAAVLDGLASHGTLRGIVRYGVGTDSVDLAAAERAGIWVARVSDYGTEAVAVHALTLVLAGVRRLREADARVRDGGWGFADLRPLHLPSTMTAGIVGFGRIGRRTAHLLAGVGFRVAAHDPYVPVTAEEFPVVPTDLDELLASSDVVSLHLPGTVDGRPLLDAKRLAGMKEGSVLVNTARGALVDTRALVDGMRRDRPRIAALDVYDPEPPDLAQFGDVVDRAIVTPHMAWYTEQSEGDLRTKAAREAARLLRGEPPLDVVVDPRGGAPRAAARRARRPEGDGDPAMTPGTSPGTTPATSPAIHSLPSPDVAAAIERNPVAVLPFGSIEQHGPHLPCGTDTFAAEMIADAVAGRLDALLVPFGPYGVTPLHAGYPGTVSLSRETFESLLRDVCGELIRLGIRTLVLVNWHEGNTASLNAVATELQRKHGATFVVAQACYVAQRRYADEGGELTHGGGIETLAVMAYDPALLRLDRAGTSSRPAGAAAMDAMRRSREVYGFVTDVAELADDGWYGDPAWATPGRAESFAATVADEVVRGVEQVLQARRDRGGTHVHER